MERKVKNVALTTVFVVAMGAAVAAFAAAPKAADFKVRLTGVAVMPSDDDDAAKPKVLPPQTRIVVQPGNLAVFYLEYDFPTNLQSRMYLGPNFDERVLGEDPFGTSASGLMSGKGKSTKIVLLGAGGNEPYEKDLLLKSVRISGELEAKEGAPRNNSFFICDAPVNVLFANKADSDGNKRWEQTLREASVSPATGSNSICRCKVESVM